MDLYKKAKMDHQLTQVKLEATAYGGSDLRVVGRALLRVSRGETRCHLDCKLVDQQGVSHCWGMRNCSCVGVHYLICFS